jgi:nicotinamidase-related amidase
MAFFNIDPAKTALLIIDFQEKFFPVIDRGEEILKTICKVVKGFQILNLPIFLSEQYPPGLGSTVMQIKNLLGESYSPWIKTEFSCLDQPKLLDLVMTLPYSQWVVVGIEAHVCVLQTAKSLLKVEKEVAILNDAISSRSIFDYSTAIAEMRDAGARITSSETLLFELIKDAKHPQFKQISELIKSCSC